MRSGLIIALGLALCQALRPGPAVAQDDFKPLTLDQMAKTMVEQSKFMLWDGDRYVHTPRAWTYPTQNCSVEVTTEEAHSGTHSLHFHADGGAWMGFGWNVSGFWPPEAAYDCSNYKNLSFWVKVDAGPGKLPNHPTITLGSSNKQKSNEVAIEDYAPGIMDGKWHEVVIPIKHLMNKLIDPTHVWEFGVGEWSGDQRSFDMYFDEIGFDNREE
jgi:hypothetical protein